MRERVFANLLGLEFEVKMAKRAKLNCPVFEQTEMSDEKFAKQNLTLFLENAKEVLNSVKFNEKFIIKNTAMNYAAEVVITLEREIIILKYIDLDSKTTKKVFNFKIA